ncbi:hypothetical protein PFISCL1PPCAC_5669, partial [Pristionchus fissidentatus]
SLMILSPLFFPFFLFSHDDEHRQSIERGIEGPGDRGPYSGSFLASSSSVLNTSVSFPVSIVSLPSSSCLITLSTSVLSSCGEIREPSNFMASGGGGGVMG